MAADSQKGKLPRVVLFRGDHEDNVAVDLVVKVVLVAQGDGATLRLLLAEAEAIKDSLQRFNVGNDVITGCGQVAS